MSMGGCFVSFAGLRLRQMVIDPTGLNDYIDLPAGQGGPTGTQTVEQAWDVVRTLLPETFAGEVLEGADLGETCFYMTPSHVDEAHAALQKRDVAALVKRFVDEPGLYSDVYWANVWQDDPVELEKMMRGLVRFFAAAASRRDAVMYWVG